MSGQFPPRHFRSREPLHRRNGKIRAREVRVVDDEKKQLGVMSLTDALRLAQSKGMDLIEVAPTANPPVCRISEYGKFMYEEAKRAKAANSRQAANVVKEVQISPNIDPHDLGTKRDQAIHFLCDDMKVRVKLRFRGRQKAHKEIGFQVMKRLVDEVAPYGHADAPPKMLGDRDLSVLISPLPRAKRAKNPRASAPEPEPEPKAEPAKEATSAVPPAP